jgi:hypothetical protein
VTAIAELQAGAAGDEFVALLRRTIRAVGVSRNFPPPEGHPMWDADALHTAAAEFMADRQTPRRLTDLAVHCGSDAALRARLQGAVRNFLADLGRRTPLGKLVLRINDVLGGEDGFRRVDGRWARARGPVEAGNDDPDLLARAIQGHDIVLPNWGHDARRAAPVADRATIVALCGSLLDAAGGTLTPRSLARAIGHRLGIGQAPVALEVNALDDPAAGEGAAAADRTGSEALRLIRATEVLAELNDAERMAVAHPEYTVRQLAPVLGASASKAHLIRQRAVDIIRVEVLDDEDGEAVALLVMELARAWLLDTDARSDVLAVR